VILDCKQIRAELIANFLPIANAPIRKFVAVTATSNLLALFVVLLPIRFVTLLRHVLDVLELALLMLLQIPEQIAWMQVFQRFLLHHGSQLAI